MGEAEPTGRFPLPRVAGEGARLADDSRPSPRGVAIGLLASGAFAALLVKSVHDWSARGIYRPMEILLAASFLAVILGRTLRRYRCELGEGRLRLTGQGWFRSQALEIPLDSVMGIYPYRPRLIGPVRFRRTVRMHSLADGRNVWVIAYQATTPAGRSENRRVFFKCGDEMLDALALEMPGRVRVTDDEVAVRIISS